MTREEAAENGKEFAIAVNCHRRQDIWQPEKVNNSIFDYLPILIDSFGFYAPILLAEDCQSWQES